MTAGKICSMFLAFMLLGNFIPSQIAIAAESISLSKQQVWETYEAEKTQAWDAYNAEKAEAWKTYEEIKANAWQTFQTEKAKVWKDYTVTHQREGYEARVAQARQAYETKVKQARGTYEAKVRQARQIYEARVAQAREAYSQYCAVPDQSGLDVQNPRCEHKWGYFIAKILVARHFYEMSRLLSMREERIIREDDICDRVLSFSGAFLSIYPEPDKALRIIKAYFDLQKLIPAALSREDKEIGTTLAEAVVEAAKQAALEDLTGTVQPQVTLPVRVLKLINHSSTAWAVYNITRERHRLLVAQEYLLDYYKYGGDRSRVAEKYKLSKNASLEEIIKAITKALVDSSWISIKIWVPSETARTAGYYEGLVRRLVTPCMEGQCRYVVSVEDGTKLPITCSFK
jgi:hypothetical protein